MINVYHQEDGLVFVKLESDSGISYVSVPTDEIKEITSGLLVRHGRPESNCGYYPLNLLFADRGVRQRAAIKAKKRPPSEYWVRRMANELKQAGLTIH